MSWVLLADVLAAVCFLLGALLAMVAAIGVLRLPDLLSRDDSVGRPDVAAGDGLGGVAGETGRVRGGSSPASTTCSGTRKRGSGSRGTVAVIVRGGVL